MKINNRHIIGITGLLIFCSFLFSNCSKDESELISETNNNNDIIRVINYAVGDKSNNYEMLEFPDSETYDNAIETLENEIDVLEDNFVNTYSHLDIEALNDMEDNIGFNYLQPLLDFESSLHFTNSMRKIYQIAEDRWLNNEELDPNTDPDDVFVFNIEDMTLLNVRGEVKIGNSLLQLRKDGYVEITDGDIETLIRLNDGDMTVLDEPNVEHNMDINGNKMGDCSSWKQKNKRHEYAYKKKVKMHVHFHQYPWKSTSSARIKSYKKVWWGWKKYRTNIGVANQSYFRTETGDVCFSAGPSIWGSWKEKYKKVVRRHCTVWDGFTGYRAESGASVYGFYKYPGHSNNMVLEW